MKLKRQTFFSGKQFEEETNTHHRHWLRMTKLPDDDGHDRNSSVENLLFRFERGFSSRFDCLLPSSWLQLTPLILCLMLDFDFGFKFRVQYVEMTTIVMMMIRRKK